MPFAIKGERFGALARKIAPPPGKIRRTTTTFLKALTLHPLSPGRNLDLKCHFVCFLAVACLTIKTIFLFSKHSPNRTK